MGPWNSTRWVAVLSFLNVFPQILTANCALVKSVDHLASSGVVHVVDRILPVAESTIFGVVAAESHLGLLEKCEFQWLSQSVEW